MPLSLDNLEDRPVPTPKVRSVRPMRHRKFILRFEAMNFGGKDKLFEVEAASASNVNVALFASQCDLVHVNTHMWSIAAKDRPGKVLSASRAWLIRNESP